MGSTTHRGYVYPDEYMGDWFNTFVSMMLQVDTDVYNLFQQLQSQFTSDLQIYKSTPAIRFTGTETSAQDFRLVESAGELKIQYNNGTYTVPIWVDLIGFTVAGDVKFYQNGAGIGVLDTAGTRRRLGLDTDGATLISTYP